MILQHPLAYREWDVPAETICPDCWANDTKGAFWFALKHLPAKIKCSRCERNLS